MSRKGDCYDEYVNNEETFEDIIYVITGQTQWMEEMRTAQESDGAIKSAEEQLRRGNILSGKYKAYGGMNISDGLLCRGRKVIVPNVMKEKVIGLIHARTHAGEQRTLEMVKRNYFWRGMSNDVAQFCKSYQICNQSKAKSTPKQTLQPYEIGQLRPRNAVAMDVATLPWSYDYHRYFLLIVDMFTRHIELIALQDQTAESIKSAFISGWIHRHGVPRILISDQGRNVDGETINQLCARFGKDKRHSTPYHPEGDGLAERSIGTVKQVMRCLLLEREIPKTDWTCLLSEVGFVCNSMVNSSTGISPHELMYGNRLRDPIDTLLENSPAPGNPGEGEYVEELKNRQEELQELAAQNSRDAKERIKRTYDRSKKDSIASEGDQVFLRNESRCDSLDPLYIGPYLVTKKRKANVLLRDLITGKEKWVHLNRCKPLSSRHEVPMGLSVPGPWEEGGSDKEVIPEVDGDGNNDLVEGTVMEPVRRSLRTPKQTEFFGELVPWGTLKTRGINT